MGEGRECQNNCCRRVKFLQQPKEERERGDEREGGREGGREEGGREGRGRERRERKGGKK